MSEQIKSQVNEEQNTQADYLGSPLPAQVEGLATKRPWKVEVEHYAGGLYSAKNTTFIVVDANGDVVLGEECALDEDHAALIVTAVNAYDSTKARVEKLEAALREIADTAERASFVQDRSVGIIKQTCAMIAKDASAALIESPDTKDSA